MSTVHWDIGHSYSRTAMPAVQKPEAQRSNAQLVQKGSASNVHEQEYAVPLHAVFKRKVGVHMRLTRLVLQLVQVARSVRGRRCKRLQVGHHVAAAQLRQQRRHLRPRSRV